MDAVVPVYSNSTTMYKIVNSLNRGRGGIIGFIFCLSLDCSVFLTPAYFFYVQKKQKESILGGGRGGWE